MDSGSKHDLNVQKRIDDMLGIQKESLYRNESDFLSAQEVDNIIASRRELDEALGANISDDIIAALVHQQDNLHPQGNLHSIISNNWDRLTRRIIVGGIVIT